LPRPLQRDDAPNRKTGKKNQKIQVSSAHQLGESHLAGLTGLQLECTNVKRARKKSSSQAEDGKQTEFGARDFNRGRI